MSRGTVKLTNERANSKYEKEYVIQEFEERLITISKSWRESRRSVNKTYMESLINRDKCHNASGRIKTKSQIGL